MRRATSLWKMISNRKTNQWQKTILNGNWGKTKCFWNRVLSVLLILTRTKRICKQVAEHRMFATVAPKIKCCFFRKKIKIRVVLKLIYFALFGVNNMHYECGLEHIIVHILWYLINEISSQWIVNVVKP